MQTKKSEISIESYLNLSELLNEYRGTHEENRLFALNHKALLNNPKEMLLEWMKRSSFRKEKKSDSQILMQKFFTLSKFIGLFSLILGFIAGLGLLSYSGHAPVNIIYYLLFSMLIPLLSMVISLISLLSSGTIFNALSLFFPLHWVETIFNFFSFRDKVDIINNLFSNELKKWMFMSRLQLFSLLFSLGLLVALLVMVVSKDIAFSWSTTLNVTDMDFFKLLASIGFPWGHFLPSAIPSVELIEMSHYYRLGENLNTQMIQNADKLGAWWKYLAMVTLFYAIFLRFLFWLATRYGYQKQLKKDFLELEGVERLLREFNTPFISTESPKEEKHLEIVKESDEQVAHDVSKVYESIIGWNFSKDEILLVNDTQGISSSNIDTVGGKNSFSEDQKVAKEASGEVILYVKSWEPPTMDFVDFLEELISNNSVQEIQIYPLGTIGRNYESDEREISIWKRKIQGLKSKKVWVIDV
jgi:hypothetical protein